MRFLEFIGGPAFGQVAAADPQEPRPADLDSAHITTPKDAMAAVDSAMAASRRDEAEGLAQSGLSLAEPGSIEYLSLALWYRGIPAQQAGRPTMAKIYAREIQEEFPDEPAAQALSAALRGWVAIEQDGDYERGRQLWPSVGALAREARERGGILELIEQQAWHFGARGAAEDFMKWGGTWTTPVMPKPVPAVVRRRLEREYVKHGHYMKQLPGKPSAYWQVRELSLGRLLGQPEPGVMERSRIQSACRAESVEHLWQLNEAIRARGDQAAKDAAVSAEAALDGYARIMFSQGMAHSSLVLEAALADAGKDSAVVRLRRLDLLTLTVALHPWGGHPMHEEAWERLQKLWRWLCRYQPRDAEWYLESLQERVAINDGDLGRLAPFRELASTDYRTEILSSPDGVRARLDQLRMVGQLRSLRPTPSEVDQGVGMMLVASGAADREMADELGVSKSTVRRARARLAERFGVRNRTALAAALAREAARTDRRPFNMTRPEGQLRGLSSVAQGQRPISRADRPG